jgi:hypothetical protein
MHSHSGTMSADEQTEATGEQRKELHTHITGMGHVRGAGAGRAGGSRRKREMSRHVLCQR